MPGIITNSRPGSGKIVRTSDSIAITTDKPWLTHYAVRPRKKLRRALPHLPSTVWAYLDSLIVLITTNLVHHFMVRANAEYDWIANPWLSGGTFAGCIAFAGLVFGLYERQTLVARSRILVRSCASLCIGLILGYACISLFFYGATSRWLGLFVASAYAALAIPLRLLAHRLISSERMNVLCLGYGGSIRTLIGMVQNRARPHYRIVGYLEPLDANHRSGSARRERRDRAQNGRSGPPETSDLRTQRLGSIDDLDYVLKHHRIDEVVVDSDCVARSSIGAAVLKCLDHRCRVTDQTTFAEKYLNEVPADSITTQWFLVADVQSMHAYDALKRILDVAAAVFGLILTLPLWPLVALLIRIDSRGPAFYKQTRVGLNGRLFKIIKFRTMYADAERHGARWARKNDVRVTRVGRLLRKTRLDELPQLWNILKGEMSLVGPRPERPEFVEKLADLIPHYRQRHLIKPGLTGWAQIRYGYGATVEDARRKLCYDLYYLKYRSIDLDAAIVIRTLGRFVLGAH